MKEILAFLLTAPEDIAENGSTEVQKQSKARALFCTELLERLCQKYPEFEAVTKVGKRQTAARVLQKIVQREFEGSLVPRDIEALRSGREIHAELQSNMALLDNRLSEGLLNPKVIWQVTVDLLGVERPQRFPTRVFTVAVGLGGDACFVFEMAWDAKVADCRAIIKERFPQEKTRELVLYMGETIVQDHFGDVFCLHKDLSG